MHWVALPDAPLDYSAKAEARLLKRGAPYLRVAHRSPGWTIWEVTDASPPASRGARVLAADPGGFEVETGGPTVVRQRYTRWWHSDDACLSRAAGRLDARHAGPQRPGAASTRASRRATVRTARAVLAGG